MGGTNNTSYSPITDLIKVRRLFYGTSRPITIPTTVEYVNPITGVDKQVTPVWTVEDDRADSFAQAHDRYTYGMIALQAKYWDDKIVLLGAFRRTIQGLLSEPTGSRRLSGQLGWHIWHLSAECSLRLYQAHLHSQRCQWRSHRHPARGEYSPARAHRRPPGPIRERSFKDDYSAPQQNQNQGTKNLGFVVHALPWFSPYFNYAETFNPPNPIQTLDSTFLPPTLARGTDVGVNFSALSDRITGRFGYYRSSEKNVAGSGFNITNINNILQSQPVGSPSGSRNLRGEPDLPTQATDVQDRAASGYEFEMTGNFTRNWRGIFNFGVPRLYTQNGNQYSFKYIAQTNTVLKQIVVDAGGVIDPTTNVASADPNIPAASAPGQAQAVNGWNALQTNLKGLTSTRSSSTASRVLTSTLITPFIKVLPKDSALASASNGDRPG